MLFYRSSPFSQPKKKSARQKIIQNAIKRNIYNIMNKRVNIILNISHKTPQNAIKRHKTP